MRDFIETTEIADNELDMVSGGLAGVSVNALGVGAHVNVGDVVGNVLGTVAQVAPVSAVTGLLGVANGNAAVSA